jgi:hypothetical protein
MRFIIGLLLLGILTGCKTPSAQPARQPLASATPQPTGLDPSRPSDTALPPSHCIHWPQGGFEDVWRNEQVWPTLGCAVAPAEAVTGTEAYLCCMHSIWLREKALFVAVQDHGLGWTFVPDESDLSSETPPMVEPAPRGEPCFPATGRHGWLAISPAWAEKCDGQARTSETAFSGVMQQFEGGWLLWNGNVCFVLFADGTWIMF